MSEAAWRDDVITIGAFDAFINAQRDDTLWELVAGHIVAMTNPNEYHEQIAANIGAPLKMAMDRIGCYSYQGGMRVQRSDDPRGHNKPRPDIVLRCGQITGRNYITDPLAVVEVLSPSTFDIDRGDKLAFYKTLPTLRHIVLVYQDQMRVEQYNRTDLGWVVETLTGKADRLVLEAVGFEMPMQQIYFGLNLTN